MKSNLVYDGSIDSNYIEEMKLLTIELSDDNILNEESLLNNTKIGNKKYDIYVYRKERNYIAHLHIIGENFNCCICLYDNMYFSHRKNKNKLKPKQEKEFNKIMSSLSPIAAPLTNWQYACQLWYVANGGEPNNINKFDPKRKQPDYSNIKEYK